MFFPIRFLRRKSEEEYRSGRRTVHHCGSCPSGMEVLKVIFLRHTSCRTLLEIGILHQLTVACAERDRHH